MKKLTVLVIALILSAYINITPAWNTTAQAAITTPIYQNQVAIDEKADDIVNTAMSLIGQATYNRYEYKPSYPYKFGCSGFIYYVFLQNGIDMNTRNTQFQADLGEYVPKNQLQKEI